jgi:DmsE family decaheme c-type cytochrome
VRLIGGFKIPVRTASVLLSLLVLTLPSSLGLTATSDLPRESELCISCHGDKQEGLLSTPHQILDKHADDPEAKIACIDCHSGDVRHFQEDPEEFPMTNPAKSDPEVISLICATCHQANHQQSMRERDAHTDNGVTCGACHQVHGTKRAGLLKEKEVENCLTCHETVRGEFYQPFRHPVDDEIMRCSECHTSLGEHKRIPADGRRDDVCFECHADFRGPFPYDHYAGVDYSPEEGRCMACHRPHGSNLPRMTNQPYEAPSFQLCSQCHSVPGHNFNSRHGDEFEGVRCNDCHVDIHGSYISRYFLSPALESQGCFNTGCHQF